MTENEILEIIKKDPKRLNDYPEFYNKDFILTLLNTSPWLFSKLSIDMRSDTEVIVKAIQENTMSFISVPEEIKSNKVLAMEFLGYNLEIFYYLPEALKGDKELVKVAIKNPWNLQYMSNALKNDKEVVLSAVRNAGVSLQYASRKLRKDKEIIREAFKNNSYATHFSLLKDFNTIESIVKGSNEDVLFSCYKNRDSIWRYRASIHPNFLPTLEQIEKGLQDNDLEVRQVYQNRKDEWLAKTEEERIRLNLIS